MNAALSNNTATPNSTSSTSSTATTTAQQASNAYPTTYQEYYQQYMQYMYSMNYYGNYSAAYASMMNQMGGASATTTTSTYYTPSTTTAPITTAPPPPPPTTTTASAADTQPQTKTGPIKFNLKFQQQPKLTVPQTIQSTDTTTSVETETGSPSTQPARKSRFDLPPLGSTQNVIKQQNLYQQYQQKQREKIAAQQQQQQQQQAKQSTPVNTTTSTPTNGDEIISDINKWPTSLKNYCSRLFQIYQGNKMVSEQQVTDYLKTRITEAFKTKSDLNIDWDIEKIPDVQTIKQVSGAKLTQKQQQQQQTYNQVPPPTQPQSLLSIQTRPTTSFTGTITTTTTTQSPTIKRIPMQQRLLEQKLKQQQQQQQQLQVSNNKRKSKSPSSDKSGSSSSSSSAKKVKKEQPKVITSKLKRNLSDDDDDDEDEYDENEEDGYESENEELSDEDFKPLSKKNDRFNGKKAKNMKFELRTNNLNNNKKFNRAQRFQVEVKNDNSIGSLKRKFNRTISLFERESSTSLVETRIVGTSLELEKEYLRLTGAPEPSNVRPLHVLKKSLDYILDKYSKTNDYRYICDQLKSIRQDLTVQMIRNEFTIQVYETHARIAIKKGDRDEFNQCQSQLKCLYETVTDKKAVENEAEFLGYRLLYFILTKSHKDLNRIIVEIKRKYNDNLYLKHLLKFRNAWHMNNYVMLFKLYKKSNEMSKYLIDLFIERERKLALKMIIKAYRPYIKLDIVRELLAYESITKCKEDLLSYGLCITTIESDEQPLTNNINNKNSASTIKNNNNNNNLALDCKTSNIQNL